MHEESFKYLKTASFLQFSIYRVSEYGSFNAKKARIRRDIQ
jgi:hypothetical protein